MTKVTHLGAEMRIWNQVIWLQNLFQSLLSINKMVLCFFLIFYDQVWLHLSRLTPAALTEKSPGLNGLLQQNPQATVLSSRQWQGNLHPSLCDCHLPEMVLQIGAGGRGGGKLIGSCEMSQTRSGNGKGYFSPLYPQLCALEEKEMEFGKHLFLPKSNSS